ncbi:MAG: adenine nucleotide alpha hydrolase [Candidatus Omnitrophica bacterium]|nr:adenine nucleotide alpha hydrolase [Candidatus Omnitrophota bacterium]
MQKAIFNWSGGKDSSLSLYYLLRSKEFDIRYLVTSVNTKFNRISMHGVREALLHQQAESIGIPLRKIMVPEMPTMEIYNDLMEQALVGFKKEGIGHSVFGDIFLEDLKKYREERLARVGMKGVFPIWRIPSLKLVREFIDLGFKAVLVCVDEKVLDRSFVGRPLDEALLKDLPAKADPCGENGEYHSFVYDGPIFSYPVAFDIGEIVHRDYAAAVQTGSSVCSTSSPAVHTGFWYCDLIPKDV